MHILGIETSCDETGIAVINGKTREIIAESVKSQIDAHQVFGGVVPEIAARAHIDVIDGMIAHVMREAKLEFKDLDGIAATCGPGLIGGVMVGMMAGKAIALAHQKPFIAVNHLEAHILTPRLLQDVPFPYLVLLVSGGHTQILVAKSLSDYELWGTTLDDACGEAFDKCAKLLRLPFPGGPHLEKVAAKCEDAAKALQNVPLPQPMAGKPNCDFSFSGLKNAVRLATQKPHLAPELAYSFQHTASEILADRCAQAIKRFRTIYPDVAHPAFVVSGGVAANKTIRARLEGLMQENGFLFFAPPLKYCGDNGVMIAWAGYERLAAGLVDGLDAKARPRWPLEEMKQSS
ncbi:MAG: tRNA (adenosine(37)-N6)-threonylcarbamoyltransferase complex transferase subunit TsaD [Alphaproteobacteria bacterium]|nr:tRNA (adenosine(37)-N6)-threonylcarbamoyltransferase complex transferase subunit TsaD [Alphaproteobacteria bacterium]